MTLPSIVSTSVAIAVRFKLSVRLAVLIISLISLPIGESTLMTTVRVTVSPAFNVMVGNVMVDPEIVPPLLALTKATSFGIVSVMTTFTPSWLPMFLAVKV